MLTLYYISELHDSLKFVLDLYIWGKYTSYDFNQKFFISLPFI